MNFYEISLRLPDPYNGGDRPIRVNARYIDNEEALSAAQKAAIHALPPGGVWTGHAILIKRLEDAGPG